MMPWGISFFHTDKDQFERLRLLVIRYKMVVGGLVCQKSIAGAIHFPCQLGVAMRTRQPAYTRTHTHTKLRAHTQYNNTHTQLRTHNIIKRFTTGSSFSGICQRGVCWDIFIWNFLSIFFFFLSSTYLFTHCYSAVGGHAGAIGARPLSLQMRLAAGIFFTQRLQKGRGRESFLRTTFIGHNADLHSGVWHCSNH